ncbi:MAG: hypothetical protein P8130_07690 [Deltaproteobacteria bacterium]
MSRKIPERDWKYLRKIQPEMLDALCARINRHAIQLLQSTEKTEHEKYLELYRHVNDSDQIVADCFNDWRRSNIWLKILALRRHGLLTDEHVSQLSKEGSELVEGLDSWK